MLKYTLCLIRQGSKILLLNREKPSWMGCWNGIGGKIDEGEMPRAAMLREIDEETGMDVDELMFKGLITWSYLDGSSFGGLYLYVAHFPENITYHTPRKTREGILDWKEIDWVLHPSNQGIADNIPPSLEAILHDPNCYNHHSYFDGDHFVNQISTALDPRIEIDEVLREDYLSNYIEETFKNSKALM